MALRKELIEPANLDDSQGCRHFRHALISRCHDKPSARSLSMVA
jgi:hypothetical protein